MSDQTPLPTTTKLKPLRIIAGCIAGLLTAFALIIAVELFSAVVHPLPPDFGATQEEMCAHVARYPAWVLALVVPAWGLTALAGTWIARRIGGPNGGPSAERSGGRSAALVVGLLLTAGVLFNVSMLPYPLWFKILSTIAVVGAVVVTSRSRP